MADKIEKKNISISNINCKTGLNCDKLDTFLKELCKTEFQNGIIQEPFKDKIIDFNKNQIKSVNIKLKKAFHGSNLFWIELIIYLFF